MKRISTIVLTKNEAKNIERCLRSVIGLSDDVIVVDCFSEDGTVDIARRYTGRVYQNEWPGFSGQRQFALSKTKNDWVLWIDADEEVPPELADEIKRLDFGADGYYIPRLVFYLGGWIRHGGWYPDYTMRLFDKRKGCFSDVLVHEKFSVQGTAKRLKHPLYHWPYRNISHHLEKIDDYTTLAALQMARSGKKASVISACSHCLAKFFRMYFLKLGILDGGRGLAISVLGSYYVFLKYIKHWEKGRRFSNGRS
jgi:glycosyltransferase involved in cell wall biosynthesis